MRRFGQRELDERGRAVVKALLMLAGRHGHAADAHFLIASGAVFLVVLWAVLAVIAHTGRRAAPQYEGCGMVRAAPHVITLLGHGLTLAWLLGAPLWIGAVGLFCDAADGFLARRLRVCSPYGALYDWTVDVTVCALVMDRLGLLPLLLVLVPFQVHAHLKGWHFSGRAFASVVLAALALFDGAPRWHDDGRAPAVDLLALAGKDRT